jgi:rhodanese-related sulfurtransferase
LEAPAAIELQGSGCKSKKPNGAPKKVKVIDIRNPTDFQNGSLEGAKNVPFDTVRTDVASPFDDVAILESQWLEMNERVSRNFENELNEHVDSVVTICYNGESARLLTSILRAHGVEAYSVKGGFSSLTRLIVT